MIVRTAITRLIGVICNPRYRRRVAYRILMTAQGIDLGTLTLAELGLTADRPTWYADSGGPYLHAILKTLPISPTDSLIDLGSGKGGAMITFARYPFAQIDGVEISQKLCQIAERNLRRAQVRNARVFCADAASFWNYDPYTFLYMFNPFPPKIVGEVLEQLRLSLIRTPRLLILIYHNPTCDTLIKNFGFTQIGESIEPDHGSLVTKLYKLKA